MVLSIFSPAPNAPVGPGVFTFTQLVPDVVLPSYQLLIEVLDPTVPAADQVLVRHSQTWTTEQGTPGGLIGDPSFGTRSFPSFRFVAASGDTVDLRWQLRDPATSALLEEARQPQRWDASWYFRLAEETGAAGGFTDADRENLTIVKSAVFKEEGVSPTSGIPLIGQVIDLVRGPPRSLLRPTSSRLLSGRGVVPASPDDGGFASWGATWSFFTVPAGFGFVDGQVRHYINRMAQFVVVREGSDDTGYVDELVDVDYEGGFLLWKHPPPTEVRYDIAPGVQLLWRWLG